MVTFTTVGYGDLYPVTTGGRIINALTIMTGIFFLAMPLSIIGSSFVSAWGELVYKEEVAKTRQLQKEDPKWEVRFVSSPAHLRGITVNNCSVRRWISKNCTRSKTKCMTILIVLNTMWRTFRHVYTA